MLGSEMWSSGRLCVFILVGLVVPSRGQTSDNAEYTDVVDLAAEHAYTTDTAFPDAPTMNYPWVKQTEGESLEITTSQSETERGEMEPETETGVVMETETQAPAETNSLPEMESEKLQGNQRDTPAFSKGDSPSKRPRTPKPSGEDEANPFFYDESTLRRRGLLVAAVLFVTGIIILTSGKCRQLSRLCRRRAYRVVRTRSPEQEQTGAGSQTCS